MVKKRIDRIKRKNTLFITPKNLENILKLFVKYTKRKKRKSTIPRNKIPFKDQVVTNAINLATMSLKKDNETQKDNYNTIDLEMVKKALSGNAREAQKLITYMPESKALVENYLLMNESKILDDIDNKHSEKLKQIDYEQTKKLEYYKAKQEHEEKQNKRKENTNAKFRR